MEKALDKTNLISGLTSPGEFDFDRIWYQVTVILLGDFDWTMPQPAADGEDVNTGHQQVGSVSVAERVERACAGIGFP